MLRTKIFKIKDVNQGEIDMNNWLEKKQSIEIISTNSFSNEAGWGYIILYKESGVENDTDEVD